MLFYIFSCSIKIIDTDLMLLDCYLSFKIVSWENIFKVRYIIKNENRIINNMEK